MTAGRDWAIILTALSAVAFASFLAAKEPGVGPPVLLDAAAPDFLARTLSSSGKTRSLADYRGRVVLLNIWATWCPPCREEMPSLERLHLEQKYRELQIVAISVDRPRQTDVIRKFVTENGLTFEILSEPSGRISDVYGAVGLPASFLIDKQGLVRARFFGAIDWDSTKSRAQIDRLLAAGGSDRQ